MENQEKEKGMIYELEMSLGVGYVWRRY